MLHPSAHLQAGELTQYILDSPVCCGHFSLRENESRVLRSADTERAIEEEVDKANHHLSKYGPLSFSFAPVMFLILLGLPVIISGTILKLIGAIVGGIFWVVFVLVWSLCRVRGDVEALAEKELRLFVDASNLRNSMIGMYLKVARKRVERNVGRGFAYVEVPFLVVCRGRPHPSDSSVHETINVLYTVADVIDS